MKRLLILLFFFTSYFQIHSTELDSISLFKTLPIDLEINSSELVVVFDNYNGKFHEEILNQVGQINGLKLKGFCENLKCFYFEVDSNLHKTINEAFIKLESKTKKFLPVLKEGTSSEIVILNCPRF